MTDVNAEALTATPDGRRARMVAEFSATEAALAKVEESARGLRIDGLEDRAGYDAVHRVRMECVRLRTALDKRRVEIKAPALAECREIDAEAGAMEKRILAVETPLKTMQLAIDQERERLRQEAEARRRELVQARASQILALGETPSLTAIQDATDEQFAAMLAEATERNAERKRAAEERAREEAAQRAELERQRAELAAQEKRIEAERAEAAKVERQRVERERAREMRTSSRLGALQRVGFAPERIDLIAEMDDEAWREFLGARQAEYDARREQEARERAELELLRAEKARAEQAERQKREDEAAAERKRAADKERERLRPQREKVIEIAESLLDIEVPCEDYVGQIHAILKDASTRIRALVGEN